MRPGAHVLVIGGSGLIGREVVRRLAADGVDVTWTYRSSRPHLPGRAVAVELHDSRAMVDAMAGVTHVAHLAARSGGVQFQTASPGEIFWDNVAMTRTVLHAARRSGVRRVFLSSSGVVYRAGAGDILAEDAPLLSAADPTVSGYAWSKLTDEVLAGWDRDAGDCEIVVGRFTNVYGSHGSFDAARSTVVHALVDRALRSRDGRLVVWGDGSAVRSFLHVRDAAEAVVTLLRSGEHAAYNIDNSVAVSIAELAGIVRDHVDPGLELVFDPTRPVGVPHRVLDSARLRATGWRPRVLLREGVSELVRAGRVAARRREG